MCADSFTAIYCFHEFYETLERMAATLLPRELRSRNEEVVQDVFAALLVSDMHALDGGPPFSLDTQRQCFAYLRKALERECGRLIRDRQRLAIESLDTVSWELEAPERAPGEQLDQIEQRSIIVDALARLTARQRQIIVLSLFEGLSHSEIAELLGIHKGTVASTMDSIKQRLAIELAPYFGSRWQGVRGGGKRNGQAKKTKGARQKQGAAAAPPRRGRVAT